MSTSSLRQSALSALKWNYLGQGVRTASSLLIGIVLARLLGPKPFGEVAIALLVIGLGSQTADLGLSSALVQSKGITERDIRFGFSLQILVGIVLTSACLLLSAPMGRLFHQPEVAPVLMALSLMFFLQSLGQTAGGLLRRDLEFRSLQIAQVCSYLFGYVVVGIPLAYLGYGVWSLVVAQLSQTAVNSAMLYVSRRHSVRPALRHDNKIVNFGIKVIATNVVNWLITNLDTAMAGRFFGVSDLGLYNRAFNFAVTPVNTGVSALQGVLFPAYSRAQERRNTLAATYLASLAVFGALIIPLCAGIAAAPYTVITGLYGPKWSGAAPLLAAFALAAPLHAMMGMAGPTLWGTGNVEREFRAQLTTLFVALLVFAAAAQVSMGILAIGVAAVYAFRFALVTHAAVNVLEICWQRVAKALRGGVSLAALVVACISWTEWLLSGYGVHPIVRLGVDAITGAVIQVSALLLFPSLIFGAEALGVLDSFRSGIPKVLRHILPRAVPPASLDVEVNRV